MFYPLLKIHNNALYRTQVYLLKHKYWVETSFLRVFSLNRTSFFDLILETLQYIGLVSYNSSYCQNSQHVCRGHFTKWSGSLHAWIFSIHPGHMRSLYLHSSFSCSNISFFLGLMDMQGTANRSMMLRVRGENMFPSILVLQTGHSVLGIMFCDNVTRYKRLTFIKFSFFQITRLANIRHRPD